MHNAFCQHLLIYDGSATPVLTRDEHPQHPAEPFIPDTSNDQIFLASGFTSFAEDSTLPISPTLQLNGDLGTFSGEQLTQIARAELDRSTQIKYRSFLSKANPGVTVIGNSAAALNQFTETYGGVLKIENLLTKGMDPEIITAFDITLCNCKDQLRLDFLVRVPVNNDLCTYCSNCAQVCPQQCIDEHLFLNLERCSFCKECVTVCPTGAIDLHGVEERIIETPALLLLNGTEIDLPDNTELIFQEKNLPQLFASIFASQIDETVTCNNQLCQYSGRLDLGCDLCSRVCTHGAISKGHEGILIDQQKCKECGACIAICPTGAMQSLRFTDQNFIQYCKTVPFEPGCTVVIGKEAALHTFWWLHRDKKFKQTLFMEHPLPGALTTMHFLFLLARGAGRILLLTDIAEKNIPRRQIQQVNAIICALIAKTEPLKSISPDKLAQALEQRSPPLLSSVYTEYNFTNRKEKQVSLLSFFLQHALAAEQPDKELFSEFGHIICDQDRCTLCTACVSGCHIQALVADNKRFALQHTPSLCVQCGLCTQVCPENALSLQPGLNLHIDFFKERILARAEPVTCLKCGKVFGTRESLTKVMTVLTTKNLWDSDDDLLSYCETCRVIKLFEAQNT
jgi:ferredoxin